MNVAALFIGVLGFGLALVCSYQIRSGFRDGSFMGRNAIKFHISREEEPTTFWSQIAFLSAFLIFGIGLLGWVLTIF
jgi:hypothetical protein